MPWDQEQTAQESRRSHWRPAIPVADLSSWLQGQGRDNLKSPISVQARHGPPTRDLERWIRVFPSLWTKQSDGSQHELRWLNDD